MDKSLFYVKLFDFYLVKCVYMILHIDGFLKHYCKIMHVIIFVYQNTRQCSCKKKKAAKASLIISVWLLSVSFRTIHNQKSLYSLGISD